MSQPTTRRRYGRPRTNQAAYDGELWQVTAVFTVKAPTWREALRRVGAIGVELVEGRTIEASDVWVRSFTINQGSQSVRVTTATVTRAAG